MILQIHDELVFEAPGEEIPSLAALVRQEMTTALDLSVPLKVDLAAGPNWLDVEHVETACACRRHRERFAVVSSPTDPRNPGADQSGPRPRRRLARSKSSRRGITSPGRTSPPSSVWDSSSTVESPRLV